MYENRKLMLLGIDGLDPTLLKRLIENGHLKNFDMLFKRGIFGFNKVFFPSSSPAIWTSIATGLTPLQHGVLDFIETINIGDKVKSVIHLSSVLKGRSIWDYLAMYGYKTIIVNFPLTYPPYPIEGVMVSGFPSPKQDLVAYPSIIEDKLKKLVPQYKTEYIPASETIYRSNDTKIKLAYMRSINEAIKNMEIRVKLWKHLVQKYDWNFTSLVLTEIDRIQHVLFGHPHCYKHIIKLYEGLDRLVGEVIKTIEEFNADVLIVSDHGFERLNKYISLPKILETMNLQYTSNPVFSIMRSKNIQKIVFIMAKMRILQSLINHLTTADFLTIVNKIINPRSNPITIQNNFSLTLAREKKEFTILLQRILLETKDPETNEVVFDRVFTKQEYIKYILRLHTLRNTRVSENIDELSNNLPDLIFVPKTGYELTMKYLPNIVTSIQKSGKMKKTGTHYSLEASRGVFIAYGPRVKTTDQDWGIEVGVLEIAPTILALYGIHPPTNMYGRILSNVLDIEKFHRNINELMSKNKLLSLRDRLKAKKH